MSRHAIVASPTGSERSKPELNEQSLLATSRESVPVMSSPFISLVHDVVPKHAAANAVEVDAGPEAQPLALFILMEGKPLGDALVLDDAVEPAASS